MEPNLITHLFIETYFKTKGLLTEEHFLYGKEREQLFESYGIFNGCEEGAEEIASAVTRHFECKYRIFRGNVSLGKRQEVTCLVVRDSAKSSPAYRRRAIAGWPGVLRSDSRATRANSSRSDHYWCGYKYFSI